MSTSNSSLSKEEIQEAMSLSSEKIQQIISLGGRIAFNKLLLSGHFKKLGNKKLEQQYSAEVKELTNRIIVLDRIHKKVKLNEQMEDLQNCRVASSFFNF